MSCRLSLLLPPSPSRNQAAAIAARGAAGPRNFAGEDEGTCAISDLAGAAAPARPNVDPPLVRIDTNSEPTRIPDQSREGIQG
jgi:hypothetical protein